MTLASLPVVSVLAPGGTNASTSSGDGVAPTMTAGQLVGGVPELAQVATVDAETVRQAASSELSLVDLVALAREIDRRLAGGDAGVVVTQGTDMIEETSFALDLLMAADAAVVVTAAMRNPSLLGADGPANLLAAVRTLASAQARGLGALVLFDDEIHAARFVRKAKAQSISTFRSSPAGPTGRLADGAVCIGSRPVGRWRVALDEVTEPPGVALLVFGQGDEGLLLPAVQTAGYRGLVTEGAGGGHVTAGSVAERERLAALMAVVLASRTAAGPAVRRTYSFHALAAPGVPASLLGVRFTISA